MYVSRTQQFYLNAAYIEGMMVEEDSGSYVLSFTSGKVIEIPIREGTGLEDYLRDYGEARPTMLSGVGEAFSPLRAARQHPPADDPLPTAPTAISEGSRTADERRRKAQEFAPLPEGEPRDVRAWKNKADPDPCAMWYRTSEDDDGELVTAHQGHVKGLWWAKHPQTGEMFSGWEGQVFFPAQAFPASANA
jgi:hypothetical protein